MPSLRVAPWLTLILIGNDMTLEKLLIFGFGLAVVTALAITATNMSNDKEPAYNTYQDKVKTLVDATNP